MSEERNAVEIRSGPATVTGDESSKMPLRAAVHHSHGEKALRVKLSGSQETLPILRTFEERKRDFEVPSAFFLSPNSRMA